MGVTTSRARPSAGAWGWASRGGSKERQTVTQARIEPRRSGVGACQNDTAGIAWAPDSGIWKVEVGIDGVWVNARRSRPISDATWVQWVANWAATPGSHEIQVRATDGKGVLQEQTPSPPAPDGARGRPTGSVNVT